MNIIIVGCGQVGETLATELGSEGNDITVIDLSAAKINAITSKLDVMGVVGNGATRSVQLDAGIEKADLLIAVTDSDELNLLCCMIAKKHESLRVIAKLQNPEYSSESAYLKDELGLAMVINPEQAAAEEIARVLRFPAANQIEAFAGGRVELLKFRVPDNSLLTGKSVKSVMALLKSDVLICTVERGGAAYIVNGDFVFEARDLISVIASPKNAAEFFKRIGYKGNSVKDAFIIGAGDITHYLCDLLKRGGIAVKVIDSDRARCEELAEKHREVTVICGDETDGDLLAEEGIERADSFAALTSSDEENIFLSLSARKYGRGKIITRINKPEYDGIIKHLDIDSTIYPKSITSDIIARYVRAMKSSIGSNVETMYTLIKGEVEATEFIIGERSPIINIPLCELHRKLKSDVIVAAILRKDEVIIPHGQDVILPDDAVIIISKLLGLNDISDIIKST